jgi:16S rRNA (cytosine967-C5)-methyltransferase
LKQPGDLQRLGELQARLLQNAARVVKPGGLLVYCTCSLEPEEGPHQVDKLLARGTFERVPITPDEIGADASWISPEGDLRTLPFHLPLPTEGMSGMDGFYAARLRRKG